MFDPTIYENLKVVIEGELYEHDLNGLILITDRQDQVNLATMSRCYCLSFKLKEAGKRFVATVRLDADSTDLYGEILENEGYLPGCRLTLILEGPINDVNNRPEKIKNTLEEIWSGRPTIEQQIYFNWENKNSYFTKISLTFDRKINEDHIDDFPEIIALLRKTLQILEQII